MMDTNALRVKELFWVPVMDARYRDGFNPHEWTTNDANLRYFIERRSGRRAELAKIAGKFTVQLPGQGYFDEKFDTLDAAMAFAQDDFEHRILSSLEPLPAPPTPKGGA